MLLTNEDLLAISQVVDTRLDIRLKPMEQDIKELKGDVAVLKKDVAVLKQDVTVLKEDVANLKISVSGLEENVAGLKSNFSTLEADHQTLKATVHSIKLFQENILLPRLNTIEACYTDTYRRYQRDCDRMETVFDDVDLLKKVVAEHSEKLQKLA